MCQYLVTLFAYVLVLVITSLKIYFYKAKTGFSGSFKHLNGTLGLYETYSVKNIY